jgi:hypothetical protein
MAERHADHIAQRLGISDASTFRALAQSVRRALSPRNTGQNEQQQATETSNRARSLPRADQILREILGALLDYPELLDTPEVVEGVDLVEGDYAAAIAALRQARALAVPAERVLAKLAPSIHPFTAARMAAPRPHELEDAATELLGNIEKLKRLEHKRQNSEVVEELHRAAQAGDFDQELSLLEEHMRRARKRHGLGEEVRGGSKED